MPWLPTSHVLWLQVADQDDHPVLEGLKGDVLGKATDHRAGSYMGGEGRGGEGRGGERGEKRGGEGKGREGKERGGEGRGERRGVEWQLHLSPTSVCQATSADSPSSPMSTFSMYRDSASGCCWSGGGVGVGQLSYSQHSLGVTTQ